MRGKITRQAGDAKRFEKRAKQEYALYKNTENADEAKVHYLKAQEYYKRRDDARHLFDMYTKMFENGEYE